MALEAPPGVDTSEVEFGTAVSAHCTSASRGKGGWGHEGYGSIWGVGWGVGVPVGLMSSAER